jgi:hypothetical protein
VRCRYLVSVEPARDLTQTLGSGVLGLDPLADALRNRDRATRTRAGLRLASGRPASFPDHALQLVDRDQSCTPRHLDRLNQRQDASVEGGAADAECFRGLCARVGEPLDACRLADDLARSGRRPVSGVA